MKTCFKCGVAKPLTDFYRHQGMADGHLSKCKECAKRDARQHREANIDRIRAYDRERGKELHRREQNRRVSAEWRLANPEWRAAQVAVGNAVRDGRLVPWPVCAVPDCCAKPEAHHPDYSRPLDVVWLCHPHHKQAHALVSEIERERAA
ncbi:hypothetical protein [Ralstonia phage GP4]|uniref:HNH endonuclease n=1 Tax=Ralstonia phage GP4 TaxID=2282904 RepID=A0A345GTX5_9CAUD|nr:endonuclease [Ralstonia phage GP4]AXG67739.1 hypothetical protein [Ralstonia phage GP4]